MLAEVAAVAQVEVYIVAVLGPQVGFAGFQVLVAEQLVRGGKAVGFFVRQLDLQALDDEPCAGRSVAECVGGAAHLHVVAHPVAALGDGTPVVLIVVFAECGDAPFSGRHQPVRQAGYILPGYFGNAEVRQLLAAVHLGAGGAAECAGDVIQCEGVGFFQPVFGGEGGVEVGVQGAVVLIGLLAPASGVFAVSQPVVLEGGGVDVHGGVVVVVGVQHDIKPLGEQVPFAVLQGGNEGVPLAVFLAEYDVLVDSGLYLLVEVRVVEAEHQPVRPGLSGHSEFSDYGLVVEPVVEAADVVDLAAVGVLRYAVVTELSDVVVYPVVVVRVVLKGVYLVGESVPEGVAEIDVRLVCVERAVAVGCVQTPAVPPFFGHDVDYAS